MLLGSNTTCSSRSLLKTILLCSYSKCLSTVILSPVVGSAKLWEIIATSNKRLLFLEEMLSLLFTHVTRMMLNIVFLLWPFWVLTVPPFGSFGLILWGAENIVGTEICANTAHTKNRRVVLERWTLFSHGCVHFRLFFVRYRWCEGADDCWSDSTSFIHKDIL